jgi:hypothetical protein
MVAAFATERRRAMDIARATDEELYAELDRIDSAECNDERTEQALTVRADRITRELEARERDASDPASPQNTAEDARDSAVQDTHLAVWESER